MVADVDQRIDHAVIVQLSGVAQSRYLNVICVKAALHIVNIDCEISINNFYINVYY